MASCCGHVQRPSRQRDITMMDRARLSFAPSARQTLIDNLIDRASAAAAKAESDADADGEQLIRHANHIVNLVVLAVLVLENRPVPSESFFNDRPPVDAQIDGLNAYRNALKQDHGPARREGLGEDGAPYFTREDGERTLAAAQAILTTCLRRLGRV